MRKKYLVVMLLDTNQHIFEPITYGEVDFRDNKYESKKEKKALEESLKNHNISIDLDKMLRVVTLIEKEDDISIIEIALTKFNEIITSFNLYHIAKENDLIMAGYYKDIESNEIYPIQKNIENVGYNPLGNIFRMSEQYLQIDSDQFIFAGRTDEAVLAYKRAKSWRRRATKEKEEYLRFLYIWVAIESVAKLEKNENIVPKIRMILGFPARKSIIRSFIDKHISELDDYGKWSKFIYDNLDSANECRNQILHDGLRNIEFSRKKLKTFINIIEFGSNIINGLLQKGICNGFDRLEDIWEYIPYYILENPNYIQQLKSNINNYYVGFECK